jgi:4-hydroxy-4-methyl-2-oxoglutarate aldolase
MTRPTPAQVESLRPFSPATLHEAMGQRGAMPGFIKPLFSGMTLYGPALTVECRPGDNLPIHAAVAAAQPGDVLVVDFKGMMESGPWGDILTEAALLRGVAGLVIDGCARDGAVIRTLNFPVFARGLNMKGTTKLMPGPVNRPIVCAGVPVSPGDMVIGDDDGVVIVPFAEIDTVAAAARTREDKESLMREKLRTGSTTLELLGLTDLLRAAE